MKYNISKHLLITLPVILVTTIYTPITLAGDAAAGKSVYAAGGCAACHGATGAGDGAAAAAMNPKPASFSTAAFRLDTDGDGKTGSDTDLANVINNGGAKYGGNVAMPARADITGSKLNDLVAYIRSLKK